MRAVKAYYDGQAFIPLTPIKAIKNQQAIITILDDVDALSNNKAYLQFAGALSDDRYAEITSILEDTQRIDAHEW